MNKCRLPECKAVVREGFLFCQPHWALVPLPLRREFRIAADRFRLNRSKDAARAFLDAIARCEHSVREHEIQRALVF